MPTIEEVTDEAFQAQGQYADEDWDDESDSGSDVSDSDDEVTEKGLSLRRETIWDRLAALSDIVPPSTRRSMVHTFRTATAYTFLGTRILGNVIWVVTTSMILVGLPYALAVEDEGRLVMQEKQMNEMQMGQQMLGGAPSQPEGSAPQGGIRAPGF